VPFGYWEAKDAKDDLDKEIEGKLRKGYPRDNIIFSDDVTAVLYQDGGEVLRADMHADDNSLLQLLNRFFAHERQEIADFNKAVKQFAEDLPAILEALRARIAEKNAQSRGFAKALQDFLKHARDAINPAVSEDDVREMLIQHILTEDIFAKVFDNPEFHQQNNVASELKKLEDALFGKGEKTQLLRALARYYSGIASTAALIDSHSEKQGFLKALYEDFYKAYNRKAADRLGVVYTPGEIVRFMIRSADWLCEKHFGKNLIDRGVEILDPATGTGTFIVELLEHFRGNHAKLRHKYKEELHANEVAILPYYVANLNIEATYQAITGQFAEYENLCLVDTLDNVDALGIHSGHQFDLLGSLSDENIERIKRQNRRKISVIIGNPPYNANQQNENDNNKNRTYAHIDKRIKDTYIRASTAHKTKLYDMYARFYRWASDRLTDDGILALVTNRSFIESRTFDGFRKVVAQDFNEIWVVDLGGDVRANPKLSGTKHNVFGIQTGVAIAFLVRRKGLEGCTMHYVRRPEEDTATEKLSWLESQGLNSIATTTVKPDTRQNWVNQSLLSGWDSFLPITTRKLSGTRQEKNNPSIFRISSLGVITKRDDWVVSRSRLDLKAKVQYFIEVYDRDRSLVSNDKVKNESLYEKSEIKWTEDIRRYAQKGRELVFDISCLRPTIYRPFVKKWHYFSGDLNWSLCKFPEIFHTDDQNRLICFTSGGRLEFDSFATDAIPTLTVLSLDANQCLPRYRYTKSGERVDNITDWALNKFKAHYKSSPARGGGPRSGGEVSPAEKEHSIAKDDTPPSSLRDATSPQGGGSGITKDAIFAYCYAVLHDPVYRDKYALNLKREFPRIPFYPDFARWAAWGEALMAMHIGYEAIEPWPVERIDTPDPRRAEGTHPKPVLKSHPDKGLVVVDADTQITGIPREAWDYRLGNRSAIDWVLDQHKEKTPRDPTIREKFNTYRFADYKESMIELLARVVRVSVDTVAITEAMKALDRRNWDETA
jgi:predicted helicase